MAILSDFRRAVQSCGRPLPVVAVEAARLRLSRLRLGLSEYMDFRLYEQDVPWRTKCKFAGVRMQALLEDMLIDDYSRFLSLDKLTMYALLDGYGLAHPKVRAAYRTLRPRACTSLGSAAELIAHLRTEGALPVYFKRSFGSYGRGNALLTRLDGDKVTLGSGAIESLQDFVASLDAGRSLGWIMQDPLTAHGEIAKLTGSTKVSGVRVHSFLTAEGVQVLKAIFKLNVGKRDSDNFEHGRSGNLLAAVDVDSGVVTRCIAGVGLDQKVNPPHPATGQPVVGFVVPHWKTVRDLVCDAHLAFPGFLLPGWDIAICEDGPYILEVNAFGDIDLAQHAYRAPFVDDTLMALLQTRGLAQLLTQPSHPGRRSPVNGRLGVRHHHWLW